MAQLYRSHAAEMDQLKAQHLKAQRTGQRDLERRAFGPRIPITADRAEEVAIRASYSQALTQATTFDRGQADRFLDLALSVGDDILARAVAVVAIREEWLDIADRYATEGDPDFGDQVNELLTRGPGPTARTGVAMEFGAILPPELSGLSSPDLNAVMEGRPLVSQAQS